MKQQNKKQYAGVWIDNQKAMIITNTSESDGEFAIKDKLKSGENFGGGSEHSMNNAKQSDNLKYFKTISNQLLKYDEILIFGPGKSQEQLQNHLEGDAQFNKKKISIDSAEHLTDPQMIAKVREFFK
jgi:stalled ribosome rescue protein Dom34